jgi:hypothetical protein
MIETPQNFAKRIVIARCKQGLTYNGYNTLEKAILAEIPGYSSWHRKVKLFFLMSVYREINVHPIQDFNKTDARQVYLELAC